MIANSKQSPFGWKCSLCETDTRVQRLAANTGVDAVVESQVGKG